MQEIEIMKNLDHPNIIKVFEYYNETEFLYIVKNNKKKFSLQIFFFKGNGVLHWR